MPSSDERVWPLRQRSSFHHGGEHAVRRRGSHAREEGKVEQQPNKRPVDARSELTPCKAEELRERALQLVLADKRDPERVIEAGAKRDVVDAEHSFGRVGHDGPKALGDKAPGLGPASGAFGPNKPKLGVVGVAPSGVEAASQSRGLATRKPAVEPGRVEPLRSRVGAVEDLEDRVPHVEDQLAEPLTPIGARDSALAKDLFDNVAQLGHFGGELLQLEQDVADHPVAACHQLELVKPIIEVVTERHHEGSNDDGDVLQHGVVAHVLGDVPLELRRALGAIVALGEHALTRVEREPYGPRHPRLRTAYPVSRRGRDEHGELVWARPCSILHLVGRCLVAMAARAAAAQTG